MAQAARDSNYIPTIQGVSNADGTTPLTPYVDSATNRLLVSDANAGGAAGTTVIIESGTLSVLESGTVRILGNVTTSAASGGTTVIVESGTVSVVQDGTVRVASISAGDNNIGNVDIITMPAVSVTGSVGLTSSSSTIGNIGSITSAVTVNAHAITGSVGLGSSSSTIGNVGITSGSVGLSSSEGTKIGIVSTTGSVGLGSSSSTIGNIGSITSAVTVNTHAVTVSGSVGLTSGEGVTLGKVGVTGSVSLASSEGTNIGKVSVTGSVGLTSSSSTIGNVGVTGAALTALQLIDNTIFVDDAAFTPASSSVTMAGFFADEVSTDSVNEGDAGAARMTLDRKLIVTPYTHNAGGWTGTTYVGQPTTNAVLVKSGSVVLGGYYIYNANAAARKVAFHDESAAPTAGGSAVVFAVLVPPTSAANMMSDNGLQFNKGLAFTMVTELVNSGSTAIAAGDLLMSLLYKN